MALSPPLSSSAHGRSSPGSPSQVAASMSRQTTSATYCGSCPSPAAAIASLRSDAPPRSVRVNRHAPRDASARISKSPSLCVRAISAAASARATAVAAGPESPPRRGAPSRRAGTDGRGRCEAAEPEPASRRRRRGSAGDSGTHARATRRAAPPPRWRPPDGAGRTPVRQPAGRKRRHPSTTGLARDRRGPPQLALLVRRRQRPPARGPSRARRGVAAGVQPGLGVHPSMISPCDNGWTLYVRVMTFWGVTPTAKASDMRRLHKGHR